VLALSVLVLCAYLAWLTRADLAYASKSATPVPTTIGQAQEPAADNEHVRLEGAIADLRQVGWLIGQGGVSFRLMPVLGTSGRLWLHLSDDTSSGAPAYDLDFDGRLRRLDRLVFGGELAKYVQALPPLLSVFTAAGIEQEPWLTVTGDSVAVAPGDKITVDERVAGVVLVTLYANDHVTDEASGSAALTAAGLVPRKLVRSAEKSWTFEVAGDKTQARAAIVKADLYSAMAADSINDELVQHQGLRSQLRVTGNALILGQAAPIPADLVVRISAWVKPTLPAGAMVLMVGDEPADHRSLFVLDGLLGLLALLMIWAIARGLRTRGPAAVPLTFKPPRIDETPPE
jgi:hypothetical protein